MNILFFLSKIHCTKLHHSSLYLLHWFPGEVKLLCDCDGGLPCWPCWCARFWTFPGKPLLFVSCFTSLQNTQTRAKWNEYTVTYEHMFMTHISVCFFLPLLYHFTITFLFIISTVEVLLCFYLKKSFIVQIQISSMWKELRTEKTFNQSLLRDYLLWKYPELWTCLANECFPRNNSKKQLKYTYVFFFLTDHKLMHSILPEGWNFL